MSLDAGSIARSVLDAVGGTDNVIANSNCMTRLRITVGEVSRVDVDRICDLDPVLGCVERGVNGIEVIFGPRTIKGVYEAFAKLTGLVSGVEPLIGSRRPLRRLNVHITPPSSRSGSGDAAPAESSGSLSSDDAELLGSLPDLLDEA